MSKKYFFHATAERINSEDYDDEDDEGLERRSPEESALRKSASPGSVDAGMPEPKEEDSDMQDWLQIEPGSNIAENLRDDAESVTDPDSDNEDNWFSVEAPQLSGGPASETEVSLWMSLRAFAFTWKYQSDTDDEKDAKVNAKDALDARMGEDSAMEYDQERIFRHLYVSL
jgi:DNA ligase-4